MVNNTDTVAAIATPPGKGGLGIIRISGPGAAAVAAQLTNNRNIPQPRYACLKKFYAEDAAIIDEGIMVFFRSPNSYTGEDVVEIQTHGSRAVLDQLMSRLIGLGCRLATPGEFTERAFHNNKIDLVQAEAVADLIDAVSVQAARSAIRSLEGEFSDRVNHLVERLTDIRTFIEGGLDFPEEEISQPEYREVENALDDCMSRLSEIFNRATQGAILKNGISLAIVGEPNVGKSTLLNRYAGREAAIVTEDAGTTRDLVAQDISIDGIPVHITDTAGLRLTENRVEQEGIRRALQAAANADIILLVQEHGRPYSFEGSRLLPPGNESTNVITVNNKIDRSGANARVEKNEAGQVRVFISAKTGEGMDLLTAELKHKLGFHQSFEDIFIARQRHLEALGNARSALQRASEGFRLNKATELLAEDLRQAQEALNSITGKFVADDLLGKIFASFCIGK